MNTHLYIPSSLLSGADRAQGYNAAGDILTQTADGFDLNTLWTEFQAAIALANAERQAIIDLLTFPVTALIERVPQISSAQFEEASEYGEPRGIRPTGAYFNLGYGFAWYDLAARFTWKFLADAPAAQVEAINAMALEADNQLIFRKVMEALYNKNNREADINGQIVPVYALYNADGTIPPRYKNTTFDGTETHYLTSGATTIDSEDVDALYKKLAGKGYSYENGVRHLLLVNQAEGDVIRQFRVATGATYDFIPSTGQPGQWVDTNMTFTGTQPPGSLGGLTVIGAYGPMLVVQDDMFPLHYVALIGTGGRSNLQNPVGFREHANTSLRGLRLVKGPLADYPLIDSFYQRGFGTGIRQRGGAAVMQITASGTYTNPSIVVG
jgi:hypothetical protein